MSLDQKSPGQRLWALIGSEGSWLLLSGLEVTEQLRDSAAAALNTPTSTTTRTASDRPSDLTGPDPEDLGGSWRPGLRIGSRLVQNTSGWLLQCCWASESLYVLLFNWIKRGECGLPACLRSHCGHKHRNTDCRRQHKCWPTRQQHVCTPDSEGQTTSLQLLDPCWSGVLMISSVGFLCDLLDFSGCDLVERWEGRVEGAMLPPTCQPPPAYSLQFDQPDHL